MNGRTDDDDDDYHHLLIHQNREQIELAATKAFQQQLEIPVVLLMDVADRVARAIVDTAGQRATIEPIIAEYQRRGVVTVLIRCYSGCDARNLLQRYYSEIDEFAPLTAPNAFHTVVLSRDAITMGVLQLP